MSGELNLDLHPKQWTAFQSEATEILYGGAAGGGKSHLMRVAAIVWCAVIPGLQVYLFRRIYDDLFKNHMEGPKLRSAATLFAASATAEASPTYSLATSRPFRFNPPVFDIWSREAVDSPLVSFPARVASSDTW
jgi:hypothetical protein